MFLRTLRKRLFERLVLHLALVLGLFQALLLHWLVVVAWGGRGPGLLRGALLAAALVAANALLVPSLRRARRRRGLPGAVARAYLECGVAVLLLGAVLVPLWLWYLPLAALWPALGLDAAGAHAAFRAVSIAAMAGVAVVLAWGYTIGQAVVDRTHLRVHLPGLHDDLSGLRLVQLSDLHIGNRLEEERLDDMLARANALDPDVIVLTGDLFDFDPAHVEDGARRLACLRARHGVYAVLGNHDAYVGSDLVARMLGEHAPNVRLLRDEIARLPVEWPLYLAGVEDPGRDWSARGAELEGLEVVAAQRPDDGPVVLLVHRPQVFAQAERLGFPLVLSGHTHGGQLALPLPGGQINLARVMASHTRGVYRSNGTTLYVNRGIGVGGPALRINCPREITIVELTSSAA